MKILYINQDAGIDWCGHAGGATHIQSVLRAMCRLGHQVQILVRRPSQFPCPPGLNIPNYSNPQEVPWECFDLVYERYSLWGELSLQHCLPWYLEINAPLIEEQIRYRQPIDVVLATRIKNAVCRRVERIITVSASLANYVTDDARNKIAVVPNCVDRQMFFPRPLPETFAFGYVGSMRPWHDLDTPLQSFTRLQERYPEIAFHVVGSSAREELYRQKYKNSKIRFHGLVPPTRVPDFLQQITCGIALFAADAPTYFSPLKIQEYLATHRTVLTHPQFAAFPNVTEGVEGLPSTIDAMERQILLNRTELRFPQIPDWSDSLNFL